LEGENKMKYEKGDDWQKYEDTFCTYGITCGDHINKIEVFGDELLRDRILDFLIKSEPLVHKEDKYADI
jgi:hypothetical protein